MKFLSTVVALTLAATANAQTSASPCLASCETVSGVKECTFFVKLDQHASELGYFRFSGANGDDCGGTNPTLGMEKGVTYYFIQEDSTNYYHPLGFAYGADGAHDDQPELEPGIRGEGSTSDCEATLTCPAPIYMQNGQLLGDYNNNPNLGAVTVGKEDFGLDHYEPQFFQPFLDWFTSGQYSLSLYYPNDNDFQKDVLYFCHIQQYLTGRIKFVDSSGAPLNPVDEPPIPYEYETLGDYDVSCGTSGLEDFQLPNAQCPNEFVCNRPDGPVGKFAECIDSANCAMLAGMTTNVYEDKALALFSHQMIPHQQNAVNMCKSLLVSGEADCTDLEDEDDPACIIHVMCQEIISTQKVQIKAMRGVLNAINSEPEADCVVLVETATTPETLTPPSAKSSKKNKTSKARKKGKKNSDD